MKKENESLGLRFLYHTMLGRCILKVLYCPFISRVVGMFLSTTLSKGIIKRFIRKNHIDMEEYKEEKYPNFNTFFTREIKKDCRPIVKKETDLISPSDGFLSVYQIEDGLVLPVKQSNYSISSLLKNEELAKKYKDGICMVFRLCVNHYHRYCYLDEGTKEKNIFIPGVLHTVRPIALESIPVFIENAREYTILHTKHFGDVVQIEVGALFVGKIKNQHQEYSFQRGEEKGMFLFGGSTIILLFQKDAVWLPKEYFEKTEKGYEISVKMGEKIGRK